MSIAFDLDRYAQRIRAFDGARFSVVTEATVSHRGQAHDMLRVVSRAEASKTLLVLAGVHGDELAGVLAVSPILEVWSSSNVRLVVLTPVNPVGVVKGTRANGGGKDINRDFARFVTPEARAVRKVFEEVRPDFVVSLHEGPQRGTFMFTNRHVSPAVGLALCEALAATGVELSTRDYFGRRLEPPGLAPAGSLTQAVWRAGKAAFGMQATIAYSQERAVPEIVLEGSSRVKDEAVRVRPHVALVTALATRL